MSEVIMQAFLYLVLPDGSARLMADLSIPYDNVYKATMFPMACAFFAIYCAGIPVLFWWQLSRHREVLHMPGPQWQLGFL